MTQATVLEARGLRKRFGGIEAVRDVDFAVTPGQVHALLGENGAGKSTLVAMLGGVVPPDGGEILWRGKAVSLARPRDARALGIRTIQQELELASSLSVAENVFLGEWPARRGVVDRAEMVRSAGEILHALGAEIDPGRLVRELGVGDRQLVEIARAVAGEANVLFMDEPTAALTSRETERLFALIRSLAASGAGIVYISHRLDEVLQIADEISIMRDGCVVAKTAARKATRDSLVVAILGREAPKHERSPAKACAAEGAAIVVRELRADGVQGIDFEASPGEIVGLFGLLGAGQEVLAESLFGLRPSARATRARVGALSKLPRSPRQAIGAGVGFVPADRKRDGLILGLSIRENLMLPQLARSHAVFVERRASAAQTRSLVESFDIRTGGYNERPVSTLSGGNQQKVSLAKWTTANAEILVLHEPTRGVDVGAREEIYRILRGHTKAGGTVVIASTDAEEILAVCDLVYVFHRGRVAQCAPATAFRDVAELAGAAF